jgi:hypothetical protein
MLLSTFVIAIVGVLITKLRNFKKKLDMIEILTRALAKMKKQSDLREAEYAEKIKELDYRIDKQMNRLEEKIDDVDRNATDKLLRFFTDDKKR